MIEGNRVCILGASGTGKSTLAADLSKNLQIPHIDSDDYYHFPTDPPFQKQRSPAERVSLLMADLSKHSSWVLSGGACVWEPAPLVEYTLIVFLYLPLSVRLERLRQREIGLFGSRISSGGDMEADHNEFMKWTAGYDSGQAEGTNTRARHESYLKTVSCPVLRIDTAATTQEHLQTVVRELNKAPRA